VVQATWQLASEGILKRFQPVLDFFGNLWNTISPYIAHAINGIIGGFDLAVRNIGTLWNTLPSVVGEGAINAANAVLGAIDDLISKNRAQVASYLIQAGSALGPFGAG
jgi:phage-related protein